MPSSEATKRTAHEAQDMLGEASPHQARRLARWVCQLAALDGLHDHDGLAVPARDLVVLPGHHACALPVGVVELQLHEVDLWVLEEQLVKQFWVGVEREPHVLDEPGLLLPLCVVPQVQAIVLLVVAAREGM